MFALNETHLDRLSGLVYESSGICISAAKRNAVRSRLGRHLTEIGVRSFQDYLQRLESDPEEQAYLFNLISTNYTYFFREPDHFEFLRERALPPLFAARDEVTPIRLWSAAAATGQEAYSMAIEALEARERSGSTRAIEILGTDISVAALTKARAAIYSSEAIDCLPPERRRRWFQRGVGARSGSVRARRELTELVRFTPMNVFDDTPAVCFDVIFLRNVMIYFDRPAQERLVRRMTERLLPRGWLVIGHSENLTGLGHELEAHGQTLFRRG